MPVVDNDVADALDAILHTPVSAFVLRVLPREVLFEVRSLAGALRRNFLGHELKSFEILSSVMTA